MKPIRYASDVIYSLGNSQSIVYNGYTGFKGLYRVALDHNSATAPLRSTSDYLDARTNNISPPDGLVLSIHHSPLFES